MVAWLAAILVGRGISTGLAALAAWLIVLLGVGIVLAGTLYWVNSEWDSRVAEPYRAEGDARTKLSLQPKIDELTAKVTRVQGEFDACVTTNRTLSADVDGLRASAKASQETIDAMRASADKLQAQTRELLARMSDRVRRDAVEIARLKSVASGPPVPDKDCAKTGSILSDLAAWRLSR